MARAPRRLADDGIYHVLNRGNGRMRIFHKPGDFTAFIKLLEEARQRSGMRILGYCLMSNHWHLVVRPRRGPDLSRFMGWLSTTHVRRWREHRGEAGGGHLYQGRFKSFLVQEDEHFLTLMRYVESNALRAGMVRRAENWPWSSLNRAAGSGGVSVALAGWPVQRPRTWLQEVNESLGVELLEQLKSSAVRGRPFGSEKWVSATVKRLGLQSTMRDPWRPRKKRAKDATGRMKGRRRR